MNDAQAAGPPPQLDDPRVREAMTPVLELLRAERSAVSSITEPKRAWQVHVADSLSGLVVPALADASKIADVGSGAGFPGLALAAALPGARVDLIESVGRKAEFIERAAAVGQLANTRVIADRAESWAATESKDAARRANNSGGGEECSSAYCSTCSSMKFTRSSRRERSRCARRAPLRWTARRRLSSRGPRSARSRGRRPDRDFGS